MSPAPQAASVSATPSAVSGSLHADGNLKVVGVLLAVMSGVLIGSSFVFKKKGLLRSQANGIAGHGVAYLKSPLWWTGMTMMIMGEICNFAAYAFVEAIVVTPMGALSVVISAILSSLILKERLTLFGWLGCLLCILGSMIIALNGPGEQALGEIVEFQKLFLSPGFLVYASLLIVAAVVILVFFAPRYGKANMLWYLLVCSMIGGISVSVTTGLGSAVVTTARGDNQFKHWFIYFLLIFITLTLLTEIYYLNVALALFNTAMVTPTYYVIFTFFSITTTIVLFKGLSAPASQILTLVMGFIVICVGITILQLSKIDPSQLNIPGLDNRSKLLLQVTRATTDGVDEKNVAAIEDPGIDTLRGSFGAVGSIIRARSAMHVSLNMERSGPATRTHSAFASTLAQSRFGITEEERLPSPRDGLPNSASGASPFTQAGTTGVPIGEFGGIEDPFALPYASRTDALHGRGVMEIAGSNAGFDSLASSKPVPSSLSSSDIYDFAVSAPTPPSSNLHGPPTQNPFSSPHISSLSRLEGVASRPFSRSTSHRFRRGRPSLFERTASERQYPKTNSTDDREESENLWHRPAADNKVAVAEKAKECSSHDAAT